MPRTPEDNELIRAARRDEIFRAAGRVFAKKGFAATKIADIAAEAKLSHGLLYHYFASKEEVYAALFEEIVARRPTLEQIMHGAGSPRERLSRLIEFMMDKSTSRPELGVLVTQALVADTLPSGTREQFLTYGRAAHELIVELIRQGQALGDMSPTPSAEELATAIQAMLRGLSTLRFLLTSAYEDAPPMPRVELDTVLRVLGPPGGATSPRPRTKGAAPPAPSPQKTAARAQPAGEKTSTRERSPSPKRSRKRSSPKERSRAA